MPARRRGRSRTASWPRRYWRHEGSGEPARSRRAVPGHLDRQGPRAQGGPAARRRGAGRGSAAGRPGAERAPASRREGDLLLHRRGVGGPRERAPAAPQGARHRGRPRPHRPRGARPGAVRAGPRRRRGGRRQAPLPVNPVDLIARKRDGGEIAAADLRAFVLAYARNQLPDYQMAAFLMAGYLRGFARRDVTATVGNVALIASSVMSKKLAGGASCILLDVKAGSGAFMHELPAAVELARLCVELGTAAGRATAALVTDMDQPLGELVGNAVEVREAVEALRGERPGRFLDLCLTLTGHLAALAGAAADPEEGRRGAERALRSGAGLERFRDFVAAQGGDPRVADDLLILPQAPVVLEVEAPAGGWLAAVDAEAVGRVAAALGAGRQRKDDRIDPAVAVELDAKLGDRVDAGQPIGRILARDEAAARAAADRLLAALRWSDRPGQAPPLVHEVVGA